MSRARPAAKVEEAVDTVDAVASEAGAHHGVEFVAAVGVGGRTSPWLRRSRSVS
jgi:hypothetical protein